MDAKSLKQAVELFWEIPGATNFRAQTGYGLIVESGMDKVGQITSALGEPDVVRGRKGRVIETKPPSGIWKPGQVFMVGGQQRRGSRPINATDVNAAVEKFCANQDWAMLRVATGKGLKMENGVPALVDSRKAEAQIVFELSHFGGRSIISSLNVILGKVLDSGFKWESGFIYQSAGNRPVRAGDNLHLSRILAQSDVESEAAFERAWADLAKETQRLSFLNLDSELPATEIRSFGPQIFLSQELTRLLPSIHLDRRAGYDYEVHQDGVVVVKRVLQNAELADENKFVSAFDGFTKECVRVYSLFCQQIADAQKQKLGKPDGSDGMSLEIGSVLFGRDEQRSTDQSESLIAWRSNSRGPHFPYEGWNPEKEKTYRVFCHKWGKGYRVSPAAPSYREEARQKDQDTAEIGLTRVECDGREKFLGGREVKLEAKEEFSAGQWYTDRLELTGEGQGLIYQTKTDRTFFYRQQVVNGKIDWRRDESKETLVQPDVRMFVAKEFQLKPQSDDALRQIEPSDLYTWNVSGISSDPDGKEIKASARSPKYDERKSSGDYWLWSEVPSWLQKKFLEAYPVCACGRERYLVSKTTPDINNFFSAFKGAEIVKGEVHHYLFAEEFYLREFLESKGLSAVQIRSLLEQTHLPECCGGISCVAPDYRIIYDYVQDGESGYDYEKMLILLRQILGGGEANKCRFCRDYRPCEICGVETNFGAVKIAELDHLICRACQHWEEQREIISALSADDLAKIEQAADLLIRSAVSVRTAGDLADAIGKAKQMGQFDGYPPALQSNSLSSLCGSKEWIYQTEDNYYCSEYSPELLYDLAVISSREPKEQSRLLNCLVGAAKPNYLLSFFRFKKGNKADYPKMISALKEEEIEELRQALNSGAFALAKFFSCTEKYRSQVLARYYELESAIQLAVIDLKGQYGYETQMPELNRRFSDIVSGVSYLGAGRAENCPTYRGILAEVEEAFGLLNELKNVVPPKGSAYSFTHYRTSHKPGVDVYVIKADGTFQSPDREDFPSNRQERARRKFTQVWDFILESSAVVTKSCSDGSVQLERKPESLTSAQTAKIEELKRQGGWTSDSDLSDDDYYEDDDEDKVSTEIMPIANVQPEPEQKEVTLDMLQALRDKFKNR